MKAARESKAHTSWVNPNPAYEDALTGFIQKILSRVEGNAFLDGLQAFSTTLAWFGALNSVSMILIKYSSAGVPDLYQGNELMDLSLVDPDNRRPVNYGARSGWLDRLEAITAAPDVASAARALAQSPHEGGAKLWATWRLLTLRQAQPALFRDGSYTPLECVGARAQHVVAFKRVHEAQSLVVIAGRLFVGLATDSESRAADTAAEHWLPLGEATWIDTRVQLPGWPDGSRFRNVLSERVTVVKDGALHLSDAFAHFPGAVLIAIDAQDGA